MLACDLPGCGSSIDPPADFGLDSFLRDVDRPRDDVVPDDLHARIHGSELVVIRGPGHCVNAEAPERVNAEVRRFLGA